MIRIFTHTTCKDCPLCDNPGKVFGDGYAECSVLKKKVDSDMSECPFPLTRVNNDKTPGRMLLFVDCSECPACGNRDTVLKENLCYCTAYTYGLDQGRVSSRGKHVPLFMSQCPFPEGRRFKGVDGDTVYGIGEYPDPDNPTGTLWKAVTSEGVLLTEAGSRDELMLNLRKAGLTRT